MSEEKEAIAYLNKYIKSDLFYEQEHYNRIKIVLNYIDKLQKDNYKLDRENQHFFDRIQDLQKENEDLKSEVKKWQQ